MLKESEDLTLRVYGTQGRVYMETATRAHIVSQPEGNDLIAVCGYRANRLQVKVTDRTEKAVCKNCEKWEGQR